MKNPASLRFPDENPVFKLLFLFLVVKILELSRFNMSDFTVKRTFYDFLSFGLPLALLIYLLLNRWDRLQAINRLLTLPRMWLGRIAPYFFDAVFLAVILWFTVTMTIDLFQIPINCGRADMLPIVRDGTDHFLSFSSPFDKTYCSGINFTYLPMMLFANVPGVFFHFDIRFLSILYLLFCLAIVYHAYRRRGHGFMGALIVLILISSPLLRFYILSIQTFPFLFLLALILFLLHRGKIPSAALFSGLALATRRIFWLLFVVLAIWAVKEKRINRQTIGSLLAGLLLGFSPALFYPRSFILNQIQVFKHFGTHLKDNLFLEHSLGFSYHLFDKKNLSFLLLSFLLLSIFVLAFKKATLQNLWVFLFLTCVVFLYFTQQVRPEEYYFLPLLLILALPNQAESPPSEHRSKTPGLFCFPVAFLLLTMFFYPVFSGTNGTLTPVDTNIKIQNASYVLPHGYAEFSLSGQHLFMKDKSLSFLVRRLAPEKSPLIIRIKINDKEAAASESKENRFLFELPLSELGDFLYTGSNSIEFLTVKPESLLLKIRLE